MTVILGYAEQIDKKYREETIKDICTSRIGGPWTVSKSLPELEVPTCQKCKKEMSLLLQLFAPEGSDKPNAYVRILYLFTCLDGKCATQGWSKSLRVLRGQSTSIDIRIPSDKSTFPIHEIISEAEPEEKVKASKKDYTDQFVENDGSEKYVGVKGDSAFHKFNKRLRRAPEQVMRYYRTSTALASSFNATLWISSKNQLPDSQITPCKCGSPRSIEFQVLPTILNFLDLDDTKPDTLDFGQLSIYTCDNACDLANKALVEELIWRQEYDHKQSIF